MYFLRQLDAVPAYFAVDNGDRSIPFIVGLLLQDQEGMQRLTPAVEESIDRTAEITMRDGLVTAIMTEQSTRSSVEKIVRKAMDIEGAILLFRCQNPATAEALMQCMEQLFDLTMVKEYCSGKGHKT